MLRELGKNLGRDCSSMAEYVEDPMFNLQVRQRKTLIRNLGEHQHHLAGWTNGMTTSIRHLPVFL